MDGKKFEVVIPIIKADVDRVLITMPYILKNLPVKRLVIVASEEVRQCLPDDPRIKFINEDQMETGMNAKYIKNLIKQIAEDDTIEGWYANKIFGWYFQQFLKMSYAKICEEEAYLVWDADTIPLVPISFYDQGNNKYIFTLKSEYNKPYFETMKKIITPPLEKLQKESFIAEHMIFRKDIMCDLLHNIEKNSQINGQYWFEKILYSVGKSDIMNFSFSEFETYGNFAMKYCPEAYQTRTLTSLREGRTYLGLHPTKNELTWAAKSFDIVSFERWDNRCFFTVLWLNPLGSKIFKLGNIVRILDAFIRRYRVWCRKIKDALKKILSVCFRINYVKGIGFSKRK